jgi:hypothetical protein
LYCMEMRAGLSQTDEEMLEIFEGEKDLWPYV